jgi:hypothetical protein
MRKRALSSHENCDLDHDLELVHPTRQPDFPA